MISKFGSSSGNVFVKHAVKAETMGSISISLWYNPISAARPRARSRVADELLAVPR